MVVRDRKVMGFIYLIKMENGTEIADFELVNLKRKKLEFLNLFTQIAYSVKFEHTTSKLL